MNVQFAEEEPEEVLSNKQRQKLRGLGHSLNPMVIVGKDGFTNNLIRSTEDALRAHELIKVKLGPNCPLGKKEAAELIAAKTGAVLVQLIGKTILLYRENPDLKGDKRIVL